MMLRATGRKDKEQNELGQTAVAAAAAAKRVCFDVGGTYVRLCAFQRRTRTTRLGGGWMPTTKASNQKSSIVQLYCNVVLCCIIL